MSAQRKNIITQKISLQLKGQKYPIMSSNYLFPNIKCLEKVRPQHKTQNSLLVPEILINSVHFSKAPQLYLFLNIEYYIINIFSFPLLKNTFCLKKHQEALDIIPK